MRADDAVNEFSRIHVEQAKYLTQLSDILYAGGETGVLLWLEQREEETFAVDIMEHFGLTAGRVANIVRKLEQRGYIERDQTDADQRKVNIFLTETGRSYAKVLYNEMNERYTHLTAMIGEEDSVLAIELLSRILACLKREQTAHIR